MRTLIAILMFAVAASAAAASKQEIDAEVKQALSDFRKCEGWQAGVAR
jgi:hypothetical protein